MGLAPAGGTTNLLWRALEGTPDGATLDTYAIVTQMRLKNIAMVRVGTSAEEAKAFGYLLQPRASAWTARASWPTPRRELHRPGAERMASGSAPRAYVLPGESRMATGP